MGGRDLAGRTALVTGASGGIGLEFARGLARRGVSLVLVSRSGPGLSEIGQELSREHGVAVRVVSVDLAAEHGPESLWSRLEADGTGVDILVNNAGFGTSGAFDRIPIEDELAEIRLNATAVTELCKRFLPGMRERGWGRILNVASLAAFQPGPFMAVYYATKAYVLSLSEALSEELRGTGVTVTALCPGPTATGFFHRAGVEAGSPLKHAFGLMDANTVAECGLRALERGDRRAIPGRLNRLAAWAGRHAPRGLALRAVRGLQEPRR